ncbi:Sb-PDE family phosphodiesterase [Hirschia litorea]|uniref:Sb-PDE family phosphodiesterase n=1 Tax=Hirschia litorea TaxID=1199156 RepID=A0ABW2IPX9_9PROT
MKNFAKLPSAALFSLFATTACVHTNHHQQIPHTASTEHTHTSAKTYIPVEKISMRDLTFPKAIDGSYILVSDLHTHSVFSDGHVWPTVRTWEAYADGLDVMAITEHLEHQPHKDDIPHPDRNRSYEIAVEAVARNRTPSKPLLIIPGAEITRSLPPGHVNAIFIEDANPLLTIKERSEANLENATIALEEAKRQGAFTFWNHPAWGRDSANGIVNLPKEQEDLIKRGLINGIEVANGDHYTESAFQLAIDYGMTILGTSDIHGLIDKDYDIAAGDHRTVTLVLSETRSSDAFKKAVTEGATVALYKNTFIGLPTNVERVVKSVLKAELGKPMRRPGQVQILLKNDGPIPLNLENIGSKDFSDNTDFVTIPAHSSIELTLTDSLPENDVILNFRVLNAYNAPSKNVEVSYQLN